MLRPALSLVLLGSLLIPARANLGDTVEQIVKRYGKPTGFSEANAKSPFGTIFFKAGGYELILFILNNREVGARVSKVDKTGFSDSDLQTIMAADANGTKWAPARSDDPTTLQWSRDDKATVMYDKEKKMLILTSDEMAQALHNPTAQPQAPLPPVVK